MKILFCLVTLLTFVVGTCEAAPQPLTKEEICKGNVDATIQAIETVQQASGKTESLSGLTIANIKQIAADKGVCTASQAINDKKYGGK